MTGGVAADLEGAQALVATACRVLAHAGLVSGTLGHVSTRWDQGMLILSRPVDDRGVLCTAPQDVLPADLDGRLLVASEHRVPNEHPLHGETLRRHADIGAVVHAHPPAVVACTLAGLPLLPIFGAYDIPAARLAHDGIPVYGRSVLINHAGLAHDVLDVMGARPVVLLRGHGLLSAAPTVQGAVAQACAVNALAEMTLRVAAAGQPAAAISEDDFAELPDLGARFNVAVVWQHLLALYGEDA